MNPSKMEDLAEAIYQLLDQFGIEAEQFSINIRVSPGYFESIKDDFPEGDPRLDFMVSAAGADWTVTIGRPMDLSARKKDDDA